MNIMQRRIISNEAGARSDAMMIVSVIFIAAFTYIALTTSPVYTGIGVGDRAPDLQGQVLIGNEWVDFNLADNIDPMWDEDGEDNGTWYLIEFMDTNCGHCINAARDDFPSAQANWLGEDAPRPTPDNINVEFLAVSISLWEDTTPGKEYGKEEIVEFRDTYGLNFGFMDSQDNSHQSGWGNLGTPSYFIVSPNGIIEYTNLETPELVWQEALENLVPRGDA